MRIHLHHQSYQLMGMPFGWAMRPWWSNKMTKPIRQWLNNNRWPHSWYVDDIMLLGSSKEETESRAARLISLLTHLGVRVNKEKSMTQAAQTFIYLGHQINLHNNTVSPLPQKLQSSLKMTKHQMKGTTFQPRHMAALAGNLLDAAKSNISVQGLPQQLMKAAAQGVQANYRRQGQWNTQKCWSLSTAKPLQLHHLLRLCLQALHHPVPQVLRPSNDLVYTLHTDASNLGWGAQLCLQGKEIHTCAQPWTPQEGLLHITHLEALASCHAVEQFLPHIQAGSTLQLKTDAVSTAWAWKKGSKVPNINSPITHMQSQAARKHIMVHAQHIPGTTNKRADWLSRNPDPKSYQLNRTVFHKVCQHFKFYPTIDLFANRHNRQVKTFCSWRTDLLSKGDAFQTNWAHYRCWLNPPWEIIPRCLQKVQQDHATALVCLPVWQSAPWWRTLLGLLTTYPLVVKHQPLYPNPGGEVLPPPR